MSTGWKIVLKAFAIFLVITCLHVWLNIGFESLSFLRTEQPQDKFRVGFLPVT